MDFPKIPRKLQEEAVLFNMLFADKYSIVTGKTLWLGREGLWQKGVGRCLQ
jgi:hypothetical protein